MKDLKRCVRPGALLTQEADLLAYSYDGALDRSRPAAVVLAHDAEEVRRVVAWCAEEKTPFVARGAGTNLSGGCIPLRGGVVLSLAPMTRILEIDTENDAAVVEPGTVNLQLQKELEKAGRFYAPDPASYRVCTIGGNVAENAGGPRCLKYGVTSNHVIAVEAVMPDGVFACFSVEDPGPDMVGLLVGAEGTLGVVTRAWLRIVKEPETIRTILAGFPSVESAIECVSEMVSSGIVPRVLEAMDRTTVESVEAYVHAGYPQTEAVLLIELDGLREQVAREAADVEKLCRKHGAGEYRQAADEAERERLWEGRRGAYAAVARIAPNVLVEDGVVPRGSLPEAYRRIRGISQKHRIRVAMLFHAGDGNLHPNMAFDERDAEETRRAKEAGFEVLKTCVELGGSISGEHGIGADKRAAMAWLFTPETLGLFARIRDAFDPQGISNPNKVIPLPEEMGRKSDVAVPRREFSPASYKLIEQVRDAARRKANVTIIGMGTRLPESVSTVSSLSTRALNSVLELDRSNYTLTVEAGVELESLKKQMKAEEFYVPISSGPGTLGGFLATKAWSGIRDHVLGMRILLASGETAELGGKVVKNVAGYDVCKVLLGSWGGLAVILDVTLKLYPYPLEIPGSLPSPKPFVPNAWHQKLKSAFDPENKLNSWVFNSHSREGGNPEKENPGPPPARG